ncbi:MAG TPA: HAMP domain-containing sensor histidine kinase [Pyrinomonadaceae bacterium]|nr:HAMP domain-containing sensor histidine kinase [Pyrinomonadaceae bacterium]
MSSKRKKLSSGSNRFRLILTLGLAVVLPAVALIFWNLHHVESIKRDKKVEAIIVGEFNYVLSKVEKKINEKAYLLVEQARDQFPSPDLDGPEKEKQLDLVLSTNPWFEHVAIYEAEKKVLLRAQPRLMTDQFRDFNQDTAKIFQVWFDTEGKRMCRDLHKQARSVTWYGGSGERPDGVHYSTTAFFVFPTVSKDRTVLGAATFDPHYLKKTFFPQKLNEWASEPWADDQDEKVALMVYPINPDGGHGDKPLATSAGWDEGKAEVTRKMDHVFDGLGLGIKFQGTTVQAIGQRWFIQSLLIIGVLSVLMIGGLVLTYRSVSKEVALARLKSDFVSNVSHELRTPLALIRLYAETLELGRITTQEKKDEYYRIIRKESERLTALINNILDFSRIEAGHKEYDFRETDVAELVCNTLDAYRYQIEQQGFEFEQKIDSNIPPMHVDREAIARALVNLVNNALKYSADEKFICVKLYRANGSLKLEVADRGIGITRREQAKIFEKFYRTGDPLVHNTRGSGLGLSLVRHITHAHGGEVEVESTPGKGSKFTLSLPLTAIAQQQTSSSTASGAMAT